VIAVDSSVIVELLADSEHADAAESALRDALARGPVVVCDVVVAEICSALRDGDQAMQALEDMGISYSPVEQKSALRAGEMQRRYRSKGGSKGVSKSGSNVASPARTAQDFIVGAHALLQCNALITRDASFFRDYFKGLKVIVPTLA
jgi:predicted nucleic acid-binding protein